ncbi:MAG: hypothetical protein ACK5FT_02440 [Sphingomonadales bacterium]|jgi:hypothetical protein
MKKHNLSLMPFLLVALLLGACSVNKTSNLDRFGGGISGSKPVHNSTQTVAEKLPDLISEKSSQKEAEIVGSRIRLSEKQQQKINAVVQDVPEVKVAKKAVNALQVMNQKIKARVYKKEKPEILKTAATVFAVASVLIVLGVFIGVFGSSHKYETTAGVIGAVMFLIGIILAIIALIMALIGGISMLLSAQFKNTNANLAESSPKKPKQKAKRRITFGHVLLGLLCLLILAFLALAIVMRGSKWIM